MGDRDDTILGGEAENERSSFIPRLANKAILMRNHLRGASRLRHPSLCFLVGWFVCGFVFDLGGTGGGGGGGGRCFCVFVVVDVVVVVGLFFGGRVCMSRVPDQNSLSSIIISI